MKHLIAVTFVIIGALPAAAYDRMTRTSCQDSFERIANLVDPGDARLRLQIQYMRVSSDSWCQIRGGDPGFEDAEFSELEWRTENTAMWTNNGIPPLALQLRIRGLDPDDMQGSPDTGRPLVNVDATLRQEPNAGQVIVERAVMQNDAGDSLAVSGVFERLFLTSQSMMQVSLGSATFKAGLMSLTLGGKHENPFGFYADVKVNGVPQAQRDAAFDLISQLPDGLINDETRAELTAFAGDLPKPVGTLEVSVSSERGLGLMQVGMSVLSGAAAMLEQGGVSNDLDILFDGLTISADWSPAAQVAD